MVELDVVVVGSGPNGLAAAVTFARAGLSVRVFEQGTTIGGGARTDSLPETGYRYDRCSAVHPMALASPFFTQFELSRRVRFVVPEISYAHAVTAEVAGVAYRDLQATAEHLGRDGKAWQRMFAPLVRYVDDIVGLTTDSLFRVPPHPLRLARFALRAAEQGSPLWNVPFRDQVAPALLTGVNAHSVGRMPSLVTAGAGLMLATLAHSGGWPIAVGGSQSIVEALADDLRRHGGEITTDFTVTTLADLPSSRVTLLDTSARAMSRIAQDVLPSPYRRHLAQFTYGNSASKVDFALSEPVPWRSAALRGSPTIHVGGTRAEIAQAERDVDGGRHPAQPYVLVSQPTLFDSTRTPAGGHVLWSYTHVPRGSERDMTEAVTRRIEEFAPGFRDTIVETRATSARELETYNPNYVGGDFSAGAMTLAQLVRRPVLSSRPWGTPVRGLYICSSSTPPGPGVHGMSGWHAATLALRECFGIGQPSLGLDAARSTEAEDSRA
ncbi:NAD(P)/FAD-dependent oxidoreductase [Microbacterium deminutum]|uniref:NAD(P)/FAD-dependent oxidoreductase n=1 Tax=Microbacterium deminutum TaxID=344164 RepID=A0ABP5CL22_9MICO